MGVFNLNQSLLFHASNVYKNIGQASLLDDINLEIHQGHHTAIIGHNGSGKSSLLKLIAGIYEPTSGVVVRTANKKAAYVPEHFPSHLRFKMKEYLLLIGEMNGQPKNELHDRIMHYADMFYIQDYLDKPLKNCSKGTKQKAAIIQALLSSPDLLLLDEPLSGLDQDSQQELLRHLMQLKEHATIVFTAHEHVLIDKIANNILELKNGKLTFYPINHNQSKKIAIKVLIPNKDSFKNDERYIELSWESDNIASIIVETSHSDQVLMLLLSGGASIIEVKEMG